MKPAPFEYRAPRELDDAIGTMGEVGDEGKVLAGGQSLVPSMNFRLARPAVLVDINNVPDLSYIEADDGVVRIGTLARHIAFESPVVPGPLGTLLAEAAAKVGHLPIRVRGTFGGSVAHADPSAEWCMIAALLDAEMVAASTSGRRTIPAADFFKTVFTTALEPTELLVEVRLPNLPATSRVGFVEFSRRAGDFAVVAAAVVLHMQEDRVADAAIALAGVGGTPLRTPAAEAVLRGRAPSQELFVEAGQAAAAEVEPMGDIHGSAEYRRDLVSVLTRRALERALQT